MELNKILCIGVLIHFIMYVYNRRIKTGVLIDFFAFQLVICNIILYFVMYFFAKSPKNIIATGTAQSYIAKFVDDAFIVIFIGYCLVWVGKFIATQNRKKTVSWLASRIIILSQRKQLRTIFIILFAPFILFVFAVALRGGNIFGVREYFADNTSLFPIYNIASTIYGFFMLLFPLLYLQTKKKKFIYISLIFMSCSIFFGTRAMIFTAFVKIIFVLIVLKKRKIKMFPVLIGASITVLLVIIVGFLRTGGDKGVSLEMVFASLLYGNSFSDVRDFAWVLSGWDGVYLYGKTYFAGLISFIPSSLSEFRTQWSFGRTTARIAGLTGNHTGLRMTIFGESYMNFGYLGLIVFSTMFGYFLERLNYKVMLFINQREFINVLAYFMLFGLLFTAMISAGIFANYVLFIPIIILVSLLQRKKIVPKV